MKITSQKMLICFQMKLNGYSYEDIAQASSYSIHSIRKYFSQKGKWHDVYKEWAEESFECALRDSQMILKQQTAKAVQVITKVLDNVDNQPKLALQAAQDILDRAGMRKNPNEEDEVASIDAAKQDFLMLEAIIRKRDQEKEEEENANHESTS